MSIMSSGRGALVFLHRWVGLCLAGFLIIEGVTGSLLAFRGDLTRLLDPSRAVTAPFPGAPPLAVGALVERVDHALAPQARVAYYIPSPGTGAQQIRVGPRLDPQTGRPFKIGYGIVTVDPWSGRVLERLPFEGYSKDIIADIMPFVYQLHINLALGGIGVWALGIVAIIWTLDSLWSLLLTVPISARGFWRRMGKAFQVKLPPGSAFRLNFDLHRAGGLWLWPLLLAFAWSSVHLTLYPVYDAVMTRLFDTPGALALISRLPHHDPLKPPRLDWVAAQAQGDRLIAERARAEGFKVLRTSTIAYFPESGLYSYEVETNRHFPEFRNYGIYFDADNGRLFEILRQSGVHDGDTITNWLRGIHLIADPLHYPWYRWVIFVFGWLVAGLAGTGIYIWWVKRQGRQGRKGRQGRRAARTKSAGGEPRSDARPW